MKLADWREQVERLGRPGVAGLGLLAFAIAFWFSTLAPASGERDLLQAEAAKLERRYGSAGESMPAPSAGPAEQLANFYAFFPTATSTPEWLGKIDTAARGKGLLLPSAEYKLSRMNPGQLARYQIVVPVQASYPQLRAFLNEVLETVPAAVIEEVTLRRDSIESGRVDARIRLSLYVSP